MQSSRGEQSTFNAALLRHGRKIPQLPQHMHPTYQGGAARPRRARYQHPGRHAVPVDAIQRLELLPSPRPARHSMCRDAAGQRVASLLLRRRLTAPRPGGSLSSLLRRVCAQRGPGRPVRRRKIIRRVLRSCTARGPMHVWNRQRQCSPA